MRILCWIIITCSVVAGTDPRGPYTLQEHKPKFTAPAKIKVMLERARVIEDAEIAVMYRSYWKSYCYQGSSLDWNTGCFAGVTNALPTYQETGEWITLDKCRIGFDCEDCYGELSDACIKPMEGPTKWVKTQSG